jgi:FkbM family methyltransferase
MLKSLTELVKEYNLKINGVIHIGGHRGQEYPFYKENNIKNIIFVEPHPHNFGYLKSNVGNECILFETALGNTEGVIEMFVEEANQGQSSSILEPYKHMEQYPHIEFLYKIDVPITTLDKLPFDRTKINFINIDVQGYELEVFKGGMETLKNIDYIYAEVNRDELYKGCAQVEVMDEFLSKFGFTRSGTWWDGVTWGDALYCKTHVPMNLIGT